MITVLGRQTIDSWFGDGTCINIWNATKVYNQKVYLLLFSNFECLFSSFFYSDLSSLFFFLLLILSQRIGGYQYNSNTAWVRGVGFTDNDVDQVILPSSFLLFFNFNFNFNFKFFFCFIILLTFICCRCSVVSGAWEPSTCSTFWRTHILRVL